MGVKLKPVKKRVSTEGLYNPTTGELVPKGKVYMYEETDMMEVRYDKPLIINKEAVEYIKTILQAPDYAKVLELLPMIGGDWNILYRKDTPHTVNTLSEDLKIHKNNLYEFVKRMIKKGILYYIYGYYLGKEVKYIMVNPHLARSKRNLTKECSRLFSPLGTTNDKAISWPESDNF